MPSGRPPLLKPEGRRKIAATYVLVSRRGRAKKPNRHGFAPRETLDVSGVGQGRQLLFTAATFSAATRLRRLRRTSGQPASVARHAWPVVIVHAGGRACAVLNDRRRQQRGWKYCGRSGCGTECAMGGIFGMAGGRLIVCNGCLIRRRDVGQAMLVKQSCRGLRGSFSAQKAEQQCLDNQRVANNPTHNAAP